MKKKFNEYCDKYMFIILPSCSFAIIVLGVIIEKHYPMAELLKYIF